MNDSITVPLAHLPGLCATLVDTALKGNRTKHVHIEPDHPSFPIFIGATIVLILLGGIFSGLTLGLMGLDAINLQVLSQAGTESEQEQAPKVLKLLSGGRHLILVVLLLCNTLVNTSLPVFLDSMIGGGWIAILGATGLELVFGEVIPQAICTKYGLAIGATFAPLVRGLVILMYPIAKPMALFLDYMFGAHDDGVTYRKAELKAFVALGVEDKLADDELHLLGSVLEFSGKTVGTVMTPMADVYQLPSDRIVDAELLAEVLRKGHTRIPVYDAKVPGSFLGVMLLRNLVQYDVNEAKPVSELVTLVLPQCPPDLSLVEAMNYFQTGRSHLLLVSTKPGRQEGAVGVVTLEDVVEELIGKEIVDETDRYVDVHSRIPVIRPRYHSESPAGLRRIFEGRVARRRALLGGVGASSASLSQGVHAPAPSIASLIDHPANNV
ncbi:cell agglutination protein Mam3 [Vanrija albida]|uniref:Cell agglutination protein Mam3 n=1 Tax=Vanrija albida TaxID=181172 RepID=A0ABR3Q621_9TREE